MINFIMIPLKFEAKTSLNSNAKLIYYHLMFRFRLSLSQGKEHFYSRSRHAHYLIYKIKDLEHDIGLSRGSVIRGLKKLEQHSLIFRIRKFHRTLIFLPHFYRDSPYRTSKSIKYENDQVLSNKIGLILRSNTKNKNSACGRTTRRVRINPYRPKVHNKLIKAFKKNWKPSNDDIVKLNQLSHDFSTKLVLKAIKITKYKEFKTTVINFITGVVRRMVIEAKESRQRKQKRSRQPFRPGRHRVQYTKKHSLKALDRYYDPKLVTYADKLAKMSHKIIYNRFNFVAGILFRWHRLGINSLVTAKNYEQNSNYRSSNSNYSNQIRQRNLVLEKLPDWGTKGYKYDPKKDKASPKIKEESNKILYKLRGNRTPKQWRQYKAKQGKRSPFDLA